MRLLIPEPEDFICEAIRDELGWGEWDKDKMAVDLTAPDWKEHNHVHNWKNYIPQKIKENWFRFGREARFAFFLMAEKRADSEDWGRDEI